MTKHKQQKRAFKISGDALTAVVEISNLTHRNLSGAIEYLILKGYKKHETEVEFITSIENEELEYSS